MLKLGKINNYEALYYRRTEHAKDITFLPTGFSSKETKIGSLSDFQISTTSILSIIFLYGKHAITKLNTRAITDNFTLNQTLDVLMYRTFKEV